MSTKEYEEYRDEYRRVRCSVDKVIRELTYTKLGIEDLLRYIRDYGTWDEISTSNHESIICSIRSSIDDLRNALDSIENKKVTKV